MSKIKLEHIDNLRRGKKSGAKIGSRGIPHHLFKYEEIQYNRALKNKYLEITNKDRVNLRNLWEKVCLAQGWTDYVLLKSFGEDFASVQKNSLEIQGGEIKPMKLYIKQLIINENIR